MRGLTTVESGKDRKMFARDAGMGAVSLVSILAGTLVAFASFAILLAILAGVLAAVGVDTDTLTANDYEQLGIGGAVVAALVLFLSYFFGGYIAGRLARRAGALNGGLVLVLAIVIGAAIAVLVGTQTDTEAVAAELRVLGVPTSGSDYGTIATVAGIVTLLAMVAGAILGGMKGERWHGKLAARAWSPDVGPMAVAHRQEEEADQRQHEREQERAGRPWDTGPVQPAAPPPQDVLPAAGPGPVPATSSQDEAETRTWGATTPVEPDPATRTGVAEPSTGTTPRARRERPLRSGRRG